MTRNGRSRWPSFVRVTALSCLAMAAGAALIWMALRPSQAGAAPESVAPAAYLKSKETLLITIGLANPDTKKMAGKLQVELLGADGKVIERREQQVEQTEAVSAYRFELPATKAPLDQLKLQFQFGKE